MTVDFGLSTTLVTDILENANQIVSILKNMEQTITAETLLGLRVSDGGKLG